MANRALGLVTAPQYNSDTFDIGDVKWSAQRALPGSWLKADGSAVSRVTYATLFAAIAPTLGTITVTIASPGVVTLTNHGLIVGDQVYFTTTGALPTGLTANTIYFVVSTPDANTFTVSATRGGSAINTSGTQSGVHTGVFCPYGLGDGSTTFNLPDPRGRMLVGVGGSAGHVDTGAAGATEPGAIAVANRRPSHFHTYSRPNLVTNNTGTTSATLFLSISAGIATSGGSTQDSPSYLSMNLFIKYA